MIAFVDESMRQSDDGLYVVAAAVVVEDESGRVREALRDVLLPGQVRFHWHDERPERRLAMLKVVSSRIAAGFAAFHRSGGHASQERARAQCLKCLLWHLGQYGVSDLTMESRGAPNDARDRRTIIAAQQSQIASKDLRYGFAWAREEPLLWLPDALAGAVSRHLAGEGSEYYRLVEHTMMGLEQAL